MSERAAKSLLNKSYYINRVLTPFPLSSKKERGKSELREDRGEFQYSEKY